MRGQEQLPNDSKATSPVRTPQPTNESAPVQVPSQAHPAPLLQRARRDPRSLTSQDVRQLHRTLGNRAVGQMLVQTAQPPPSPNMMRRSPGRTLRKGQHNTIHKEVSNTINSSMFISEDFAENHVRQVKKLKGQSEVEYARQEAQRRGVTAQTVLFVDEREKKEFVKEVKIKNETKYFHKQIQKNGGIPAQKFFTSDTEFHFVTIQENGPIEGIGRIVFTVKNLDIQSASDTPLYCVNHLEAVQQTNIIETVGSGNIEEADSDYESEDEFDVTDEDYE